MMRGGRIAVGSLLACGALAVLGAGVVQAAGEKVTSTLRISPAKPKIGKSGKPVPVKFSFTTTIAGPNPATREAATKTLYATFPKGLIVDAKKFQVCPLATLNANKPDTCPAKSVVGHIQSTVNATPLTTDPMHTTGTIYVTGKTATGIKWAGYATGVEIKTLHGVVTGTLRFVDGAIKYRLDFPRLISAPGLPDGTNLEVDTQFDARGSDGGQLIRAKKACAKAWTMPIKYDFYDGSSSRTTAKAAC